jgi:hypothetical protein
LLQAGHKVSHKTPYGTASMVVSLSDKPLENCSFSRIVQDGSQGWSWPQEEEACPSPQK